MFFEHLDELQFFILFLGYQYSAEQSPLNNLRKLLQSNYHSKTCVLSKSVFLENFHMYIDSNGKSAKADFGFVKQKQSNLKRLGHLQRQLARKVKGSKNRQKLRIKISSLEEHIANARLDWIEKESLRLTKTYKLIGLENLNIKGMMQGSKNAKNYQDIAWSTFVSKLQWKGEKNGCYVVKIDRWFSSSQTCNCCGFKNKEVQAKHLEKWICPECEMEHQRDENAAKKIAAESYKVLREAEENEVKRLKTSLSKDTRSLLPNNNLVNLAKDALASDNLVMQETILGNIA